MEQKTLSKEEVTQTVEQAIAYIEKYRKDFEALADK